jgi:hypothetical protein
MSAEVIVQSTDHRELNVACPTCHATPAQWCFKVPPVESGCEFPGCDCGTHLGQGEFHIARRERFNIKSAENRNSPTCGYQTAGTRCGQPAIPGIGYCLECFEHVRDRAHVRERLNMLFAEVMFMFPNGLPSTARQDKIREHSLREQATSR